MSSRQGPTSFRSLRTQRACAPRGAGAHPRRTRRRRDVADEAAEAEAAVESGAVRALMRGASRTEAAAESQAAAENVLASRFSDEGKPAELDDFGRDVGAARRSAAARRASARQTLRFAESQSGTRVRGKPTTQENAEEMRLFNKGCLDVRGRGGLRDAGRRVGVRDNRAGQSKGGGLETTVPEDVQRRGGCLTPRLRFSRRFVRLELLSWSPLFLAGSW